MARLSKLISIIKLITEKEKFQEKINLGNGCKNRVNENKLVVVNLPLSHKSNTDLINVNKSEQLQKFVSILFWKEIFYETCKDKDLWINTIENDNGILYKYIIKNIIK